MRPSGWLDSDTGHLTLNYQTFLRMSKGPHVSDYNSVPLMTTFMNVASLKPYT